MAALNGCFSCLKFLVFTINFLLWLFGLGVVAVSLWLLFDSDLYLQTMSDQRTDYFLGTYIILAIGALVTLMGFLGCCGAWKESPWMLGSFFAFLLIIFFGEIAVGIVVYFQGSNYNAMIDSSVKQTVEHKYQENNTAAMKTFDMIQEGLECCGVDGPKSWAHSAFNNYDFKGQELGIVTTQNHYTLPRSCCKIPESTDCSNSITLAQKQGLNGNALNTQGCAWKLTQFMEHHIIYLVAASMGIFFMEILGMLCSLCLCCAVKRIEDMKA